MSRTMSAAAISAVGAQQTSEVFLYLLTVNIVVDGEDQTFYFVNNREAIVRDDQTYTPLGFKVTLPNEGDNVLGAQITIDVVDRVMIQAIREAEETPTVSFVIILASDPDGDPEAGPFNFEISSVSYNAYSMSCTLGVGKHLDAIFPKTLITPYYFPGLF